MFDLDENTVCFKKSKTFNYLRIFNYTSFPWKSYAIMINEYNNTYGRIIKEKLEENKSRKLDLG